MSSGGNQHMSCCSYIRMEDNSNEISSCLFLNLCCRFLRLLHCLQTEPETVIIPMPPGVCNDGIPDLASRACTPPAHGADEPKLPILGQSQSLWVSPKAADLMVGGVHDSGNPAGTAPQSNSAAWTGVVAFRSARGGAGCPPPRLYLSLNHS